jgi:hypothetical protein
MTPRVIAEAECVANEVLVKLKDEMSLEHVVQ